MKKEIKITNEELFYNRINIKRLAQKYGTPLKITFLEVIKNRILELQNAFENQIIKCDYQGKFIYLNANKANYGYSEVATAYEYADGLECSSYHDLLYTIDLINGYLDNKYKYIVCNGIKKKDYIDEIVDLCNKGYHIITIIDSQKEYEEYKKCEIINKLEVGIRIHLKSLYNEKETEPQNDRFGVNEKEFEYIINDIKNNNKLLLTTIHFHQRGFDFEREKFIENIEKCFNYYEKASHVVSSICNFDIGGGTPLPVDNDFDYQAWAKLLINTLQKLCVEKDIKEPNIISENGKYSQKDSTINVYEIVDYKETDDIPWYIVDGSLLIALPEHYALGEEILVLPVNGINGEMVKTRLAGITCDCDDVFFNEKLGFIFMPKKTEDNKVYVALLGTGSYQNSMNGKGGTHHCLLPEEIDLVVHQERNLVRYEVRGKLQTIDEMKKILKFKDRK